MAHKQLISRSHSSIGKHPDHSPHLALASGRVGHAEEPSDRSAGGFSTTLRRVILPPILSVATAAIAVTAMAVATAGSADPTAMIPVLAPIATAVGSLIGGITAGLCCRRRAMASAMLCGGMATVLLCLIGLSADNGTAMQWLIRLMPLPLHAIGGLLTRRSSAPRGHRATHEMK